MFESRCSREGRQAGSSSVRLSTGSGAATSLRASHGSSSVLLSPPRCEKFVRLSLLSAFPVSRSADLAFFFRDTIAVKMDLILSLKAIFRSMAKSNSGIKTWRARLAEVLVRIRHRLLRTNRIMFRSCRVVRPFHWIIRTSPPRRRLPVANSHLSARLFYNSPFFQRLQSFDSLLIERDEIMAIPSPRIAYDSQRRGDRLFFGKDGQTISPWHDIPLFADSRNAILNMVVEIPRGSYAKMEESRTRQIGSPECLITDSLEYQISTEESHNPIKQDVVNGEPRMLADIPPFRGYPCNYGAFPQVAQPRILSLMFRLFFFLSSADTRLDVGRSKGYGRRNGNPGR